MESKVELVHRHRKSSTRIAASARAKVATKRTGLDADGALSSESAVRVYVSEAAAMLGGEAVFKHPILSRLDVHEAIVKGLPSKALRYIVGNVKFIDTSDVLKAVGVSRRTVQRHKERSIRTLSLEQSGRTWKFAEVLAMAKQALGSQERAEEWLTSPALGLDQRRPIDLLSSPVGAEAVEQLLGRLEYGVYT